MSEEKKTYTSTAFFDDHVEVIDGIRVLREVHALQYTSLVIKDITAREKLLVEAFKELLNESKAFLSVSSPTEVGRANYGAFNEKVRKADKALAAYGQEGLEG